MAPIAAEAHARRNRFDRMEWAGAFGDLGTLIPFLAAYITLLDMDPFGILLAFGLAKIAVGLLYRTPFPVQPMKAIGATATTQAAQTLTLTAHTVLAAGLVTGAIWLVLGATGATRRLARLIPRSVTRGIVLGLGLSFLGEGLGMMAHGWWLGALALAGTLTLLRNRRVPAMFVLLLFGAAVALIQQPDLWPALASLEIAFRLPEFALGGLTWHDLLLGTVFLALPQLPLTFGNAVVGVTEENNRLFPDRATDEKRVAVSTGLINLLAAPIGGVPMCHGAGGMAGHVRFGARTGGALIILGGLLVLIALFLSDSVDVLVRVFPLPVLGVILFLAGAELALGALRQGVRPRAGLVLFVTAALATWNIGLAFVAGLLLERVIRRSGQSRKDW